MNKPKKLAENIYEFPHWRTIAGTYPEAVQIRLDEIAATRPFYNWRKGQINGDHLRETDQKKLGIEKCTKKNITTLTVQLGKEHKGESVETARSKIQAGEFGLGAYEMLCILLADPDILKSSNDLWIDCPGDEFDASDSDGRFDHAPFLGFSHGELLFDTGRVDDAFDRFGSGSFFLP